MELSQGSQQSPTPSPASTSAAGTPVSWSKPANFPEAASVESSPRGFTTPVAGAAGAHSSGHLLEDGGNVYPTYCTPFKSFLVVLPPDTTSNCMLSDHAFSDTTEGRGDALY